MSQVIVPQVVSVLPPTLTKGTQGATGYSTQDLKDSGRVNVGWTVDNFVTTTASEALLTVSESRDGATATTFTTKVITNAKRLRIMSITATVAAAGTTPTVSRIYFRMRVNTAGAATTSSPLQAIMGLSTPATANTVVEDTLVFPDGVEFAGNGTVQIGFSVQAVNWVTTTNTPQVCMSISAFEY